MQLPDRLVMVVKSKYFTLVGFTTCPGGASSCRSRYRQYSMAFKLGRVLISDSVDASCREILEGSGIPVDYKPGTTKDQLLTIIKVDPQLTHQTLLEFRPLAP
jgi:hypothetical protein